MVVQTRDTPGEYNSSNQPCCLVERENGYSSQIFSTQLPSFYFLETD